MVPIAFEATLAVANELTRFYRVILEVPRMKPLLLVAFVQMLREDYSSDETTKFGQLWNSFLAIWQIFTSEEWTDVWYGASSAEIQLGQTLIVIVFSVLL